MSTTETTTTGPTTGAYAPPTAGIGTVRPDMIVRALSAVMPHAGTDQTLPMLCTVKIETRPDTDGEGTVLVFIATDRYTLATYRIGWDGGEVDALLTLADAKALHAFAKGTAKTLRDFPSLSLTFTADTMEARDLDGRRSVAPLLSDVTFVKWQAIMPGEDYGTDGPGVTHVGLNPAFLARFAKVGERGEPMRLAFGPTAVKPVRVTIGEAFVGLIMPVRLPDATPAA